jgi:hypothetical protein
VSCPNCRDTQDARDAAVRACRLDLDAAIRERDEANRTGLALVQATNVLRERIRVRDEALKLAEQTLVSCRNRTRGTAAAESCDRALVAIHSALGDK